MSTFDMAFDGAFASACATVVSNPFDVVRTRMQLQGQMMKAGEYEVLYTNLFQATCRMAKEEGLLSLQKGLTPAVLWQVTQNGIRIGLYPLAKTEIGRVCDSMQEEYHRFRTRVSTGSEDTPPQQQTAGRPLSEAHPFIICVSAGALCGVAGAVVASPFALVKTRLQSEHSMPLKPSAGQTAHHLAEASTGTQFHYTGVFDAMRKIYNKGGVKGLWHGCGVAAQRTMVGSAVQLTSYDYCRAHWARLLGYPVSDTRMHILAAISASLFVVLFMNPCEVVSTRSYNTHIGAAHQSSNIFKQIFSIYRVEGVRGMYKGSVALFARSAPHSVATFVVLEWVRKMRETYTPDRAYTKGSSLNTKNIGVFSSDNTNSNTAAYPVSIGEARLRVPREHQGTVIAE